MGHSKTNSIADCWLQVERVFRPDRQAMLAALRVVLTAYARRIRFHVQTISHVPEELGV